jgi:hypothetical protein
MISALNGTVQQFLSIFIFERIAETLSDNGNADEWIMSACRCEGGMELLKLRVDADKTNV